MIDIRKLSMFNEMANEGANTVANQLTQMTQIETEMQITKINFLDIENIRAHMGYEDRIAVRINIESMPNGCILIFFDEKSAKTLSQVMLAGMVDDNKEDGEFNDMEQSAIQEIGNIMTSGFIDGWANVLETTIEIGTPTFYHTSGSNIVDEEIQFEDDDIALLFDSRIHTPKSETDSISGEIYVFPNLKDLVKMMNEIELKT
ncbi:Chemotaxis protein CheC inhibitor of MCP methylation [Methanonatronarchaeum thermophilum]|uniref:Chemotaxis protein CheC inhibitor of MCP methylation n=2 Tax=Methanonatronarchaeum thermophilum TaxID=1927129 RepID=A0A1Y3G9U9_9EURY|nr:Chemotaxis protein CheC inhibitor of MCP methylation [Methanonatronarchaeum thermophilum]